MTPIDVIFCTAAKDPLRKKIAAACLHRWGMWLTDRYQSGDRESRLLTITSETTPENFMLTHRSDAEQLARTPIYCHADDDCMPLGNSFMEHALAVMTARPQYGLLAFMDTLIEADYYGHDHDELEDPEITPCGSPGGIYLVRKGIVDFPESHPWFDDVQMSGQVEAHGFKVGRFSRVHFNHLGYRLSTTFPERTGLTQIADL